MHRQKIALHADKPHYIHHIILESGLFCERQDESQNDALLSLARDTPAHVQT